MFRNRTSSQKPRDELYENFRQHFPAIVGAPGPDASTTSGDSSTGVTALQDHAVSVASCERQQHLGPENANDQDPTPRAQHELWRFTPSILDPNSFAFTAFAHQPPGYYTPTPGGSNTLFHSQAGDLHTPSVGMGMSLGLGTPFSMPSSELGVHPGPVMDFASYHQGLAFQNYNAFSHLEHSQQLTYAPSAFMHHDTGYETMEPNGSPMDKDVQLEPMDSKLDRQSPDTSYQSNQYESSIAVPMSMLVEKFRFHVILNAPTAMIKHADEIPVTYLNKGQAYSISIVDTALAPPTPPGTRYRTFVRISFEDEQQRQKPATCWQLWKEGRGTNEAHHRGGKLQAVEYVEAGLLTEGDDKRAHIELDTASFDGFSVSWSPGANAIAECNLAVRFNFLSTDFSHSKGVKGIPVRLCAKTQIMTTGSPRSTPDPPEVAFCKVKLFRDHGAERKLSNDIAHVKKTIDKLKQQIAQAEISMKDFSKRKRSGSVSIKAQASDKPGKVQKHKRTWSISSTSSAGGRAPSEEDLHFKLQTMQDMFSSTRPVSVLYLRGTEEDDPDVHPVILTGAPLDLTKVDSRESIAWQQRGSGRSSPTAGNSLLLSPSPSSISLGSQGLASSTVSAPSAHWTGFKGAEIQGSNPQQLASPPDQVTKLARADDTGGLSGWIEALGVDPSYKPTLERAIKPVACFYIAYRDLSNPDKHEYYRAIYLMRRTLKDFTNGIALKWNLEPTKIRRTLHVSQKGLEVEVDDDIIREFAEGQDMILEIYQLDLSQRKCEWERAVNGRVDSDTDATQTVIYTDGYELRLYF